MPAMRILTLMTGLALLAACGGGGGGGTTTPTPTPPPPSGGTLVSDIQGSGATSPLAGQTVTVRGQVTGDFQEGDGDDLRNLGGFYLQDGPPDSDFDTSDGVFVFDGDTPPLDVDVGDVVEVRIGRAILQVETAKIPAIVTVAFLEVPRHLSSNGDGLSGQWTRRARSLDVADKCPA